MRDGRLQNKIATSSLTLPTVAIITAFVWMTNHHTDGYFWLGLLVTGIVAYIIVEFNNYNTLLRIRSQLMSSVFVSLMMCATMLHSFTMESLIVICVVLTYFLLFGTYQKVRSEGRIFHAFVSAGIGSLLLPQLLLFVPFYYLAMMVQLRSFTLRTFLAGLFGLLLPYLFYASYLAYISHLERIIIPFEQLADIKQIVLPTDKREIALLAFVGGLSLVSIIDFWRTRFNDKIRTRLFFNILIFHEFLLILFIALQSQHFKAMMPVLIMNSCPIIAHYFALSRTILCKLFFIAAVLGIVVLTIYNLWIF